MTHARLVIDGKTVMDEEMGEWEQRPPEFFKRVMTPGQRQEPHLKAVAIILAESLLAGQDVSIDVAATEIGAWTMSVKQSAAQLPL